MRIAEERAERRRWYDEEREERRQEREIRKLQMEAELQRQKVEIEEAKSKLALRRYQRLQGESTKKIKRKVYHANLLKEYIEPHVY